MKVLLRDSLVAALALLTVPVATQASGDGASTMTTDVQVAQMQDKATDAAKEAKEKATDVVKEKATDTVKEQMPDMPSSGDVKAPETPDTPKMPGKEAVPSENMPKMPGK